MSEPDLRNMERQPEVDVLKRYRAWTNERCEAESESFGQCSLERGHAGCHFILDAEQEESSLRQQLAGAVSVVEAAKALKWNAVDGHDEGSDVIVSRESWTALRAALRGQ